MTAACSKLIVVSDRKQRYGQHKFNIFAYCQKDITYLFLTTITLYEHNVGTFITAK